MSMLAPGLWTYLVGGGLAGLIAAVAMDLPMSRQSDGWTPARIAASLLRGAAPEAIPLREVVLVHHGAGILAGGLYGLLAFVADGAVPGPLRSAFPILAHLPAVVAVTLFIYLFFAHIVLPRAGGDVYERRATAVRGQWFRSTLTFALTVTVAGPLLISSLGTTPAG